MQRIATPFIAGSNPVPGSMGSTSEARKRREEALKADFCLHSGFEPSCIGCWKGLAVLQEAHIVRLRQLAIAAGADWALEDHDNNWFGQTWERSLRTP